MRTEVQLEIEGIGQQLATLDGWKQANLIFTHKSNGFDSGYLWTAWDEIECPHDFGHQYGFEAMGYGDTEQEAILDYCRKEQITPPFWWGV